MGNSAQSSMPTSTRTSTRTSMPTQELDAFIQKFLRPFEDCQKQIDEAVDTICAALHETKEFLVTDVAKGGSYGRETVLRGHSDGTLVIFISDLETFTDQKKIPYEIVHKIWNWLKHCQLERKLAAKIEILMSSSGPVVELSTTGQSMTFKVLPAFNALGLIEKPSPWTYRELKSSLDMTKASPGEFSVCFTKLQQNFFNNHPRKLKDLILLVKYWYQQCEEVFMIPLLLSSYALELLTVYAWEQGCGAEDFEMVEGIRTVLGLIQQPKHLCVYWTVNYNFEDETVRNIVLDQIQACRPVILDPTDPTNNVSKEYRGWFLQLEAKRWLSRLNESPGPSWNVLDTGHWMKAHSNPINMTLAKLADVCKDPISKSGHSQSQPSSLRETPDYHLDEFIKDFLQPSEDFLNQIHKAVGIICSFLEENCFRHSTTKVQKVVQGGSAGKGTTLKTGSDADFVVFTTSLNSYTSQNTERCKIIKEIHEQLEACQQEEKFKVKFEISKRKFPRVLSFSLKSKQFDETIDFDVLPAFNALDKWKPGSTPSPQVYTDLISLYNSSKIVGGEFSTCFTELQRDFVISRPTKLKDLIRLVKHWYKQCEKKLKKKGSLPPKYALELLTIYAWEQGSGLVDFDTAEGFRTVLELIRQHQQLCIFWTVNYNFEDVLVRDFLLTQLQKTRPVILDPAEPTGDVGGGDRWCWHLLAKEATEWLSFPCLIDNNGHPVQFWNVPVRII